MALNLKESAQRIFNVGLLAALAPFNNAIADNWDKTIEYMREEVKDSPALLAPRYSREHPTTPTISVYIGKDSPQTPEQWKDYLESAFKKYGHTVEVFAIEHKELNQTVFDAYVSGVEIKGDFRNTQEGIKALFVESIKAQEAAAGSTIVTSLDENQPRE